MKGTIGLDKNCNCLIELVESEIDKGLNPKKAGSWQWNYCVFIPVILSSGPSELMQSSSNKQSSWLEFAHCVHLASRCVPHKILQTVLGPILGPFERVDEKHSDA